MHYYCNKTSTRWKIRKAPIVDAQRWWWRWCWFRLLFRNSRPSLCNSSNFDKQNSCRQCAYMLAWWAVACVGHGFRRITSWEEGTKCRVHGRSHGSSTSRYIPVFMPHGKKLKINKNRNQKSKKYTPEVVQYSILHSLWNNIVGMFPLYILLRYYPRPRIRLRLVPLLACSNQRVFTTEREE